MTGADAALELARWNATRAYQAYQEAYTANSPGMVRVAAEEAERCAVEAETLARRWGGRVGFVAGRARKSANRARELMEEQS